MIMFKWLLAQILLCVLFLGCSQNENGDYFTVDYQDTSFGVMTICTLDTLKGILQGNDVVEYTAFDQDDKLRPIFRIPEVVVTNQGTTLVSCENRSVFADKGEIDILVSRKERGDSMWHIRNVIPQASESYGRSMNPVFLIDRNGYQGHKGRIYLFACHLSGEGLAAETTTEQADIIYKYSDDDGKTWSPEHSLKHLWNLSEYSAALPSAANGIQMNDGTFLLPTMVVKDGKWRSGLLYKKPDSDWKFSSPTPNVDDNECTVFIDKGGRIILDCRTKKKIRNRYSFDIASGTFCQLQDCPVVKINLKAEIRQINTVSGIRKYLMSFVDTEKGKRENLTLYSSSDALNWERVYRLQEGVIAGAYSNVSSYNGQTFVTYETGDAVKVQDISFFFK